jgi:membrane protease YdiL (CAAX protease family)
MDDVSLEPVSSSQPVRSNGIFIGRFGLRAGWGMAIFFIAVIFFILAGNVVGAASIGMFKEFIAAQTQHTTSRLRIPLVPAVIFASRAVDVLGMLALCWVFSKGERRRFAVYGIGKNRFKDFAAGALWGLLTLSLLVLILYSLHLLVFDARLLSTSGAFRYGAEWLVAFLMVGLSEEYMLRGYLQYTLTRGLYGLGEKISPASAQAAAFWIAAVIMSILFSAGHLGNARENPMGLVMVFIAGMVFSYALWRTGSLWWAIGCHMTWDWAQSFLYGVPDSGQISIGRLFQTHPAGNRLLSGDIAGPEGSVYVIPIMLLTVVIIRFTTVKGSQPSLEPNRVAE